VAQNDGRHWILRPCRKKLSHCLPVAPAKPQMSRVLDAGLNVSLIEPNSFLEFGFRFVP
jgi:hypothetical protein